jgi:hypothetical protein
MDNRARQSIVYLHPKPTSTLQHFINTVWAPTRPKKQDEKVYLEGLAMSATLLELLNYALELDRVEEVAGLGHPQLYL